MRKEFIILGVTLAFMAGAVYLRVRYAEREQPDDAPTDIVPAYLGYNLPFEYFPVLTAPRMSAGIQGTPSGFNGDRAKCFTCGGI